MASSSSVGNSQCPRWKYDVFLSFRGKDTRRNFTSHLYEGLRNRGIFTFEDDKRLKHGTSITEELLKAIKESQVAVIIFSKNYATSRWCLDELVKIMKCKDDNGQTVIPVFYDVDPSEVRNQRESFAEAFVKHESMCKDDVEGMQKVQGWRTALTAAANLKGYDIRQGIESKNIQQIVEQISSKLCKSASFSSLRDVVGMNVHLEKLKSLLDMETDDVRIVGIWGMGGVAKTTIARFIFDTLYYQFEAACFLADVKENGKKNQLHSLQNTLLSELLRRKDDYVNNKFNGKDVIRSRLYSKKVLVVLDDIDHTDHLQYLAGDLDWFGNGSRVVVTTRNRHLIEKDDAIYEVNTLPDHEATQLFNQHAFKKEVPSECFMKLSLEVVNHAKGLPLSLKVWGSFLHKRNINVWRSAIEQMKNNSSLEIIDKLKISYDGLEPIQQDIFLDIACFLRGRKKDEIMQILESCHIGAEYGLDILIEKSLVFLSEKDTIEMHDLIQDMGKYVVNMQKEPGERSRLWLAEDFEEVMVNNTHFPYLRTLNLSGSKCLMRTPDCSGMPNLEYLSLSDCRNLEEVHHSLGCSKKLIELNLRDCKSLKRFPCVNVESLEYMHLQDCSGLEKFPEIIGRMKLELKIHMGGSGIRELPSSIQYQTHIAKLDLSCLKDLVSLPSSICRLKSLVSLNVSYCSKLESLPEEIGDLEDLEQLDARDTLISQPPPSVVRLNKLKFLSFAKQISEVGLEDGVRFVFPPVAKGLHSLEILNLSNCNLKDGGLPEDIECLSSLKELYLAGNNFDHLPRSIVQFGGLRLLDFSHGKRLKELPDLMGMPNLESLYLSNCMNLEEVHHSLGFLKKLCTLELTNCKRLKWFPALCIDSLEYLWLQGCSSLQNFPEILGSMKMELENHMLDSVIKDLDLRGLEILALPISICRLKSLVSLNVSSCSKLGSFPETIGDLENLEWIDAKNTRISQPPPSIVRLNKLKFLSFAKQKSEVGLKYEVYFVFPRVNEGLRSLEILNLSYCNLIDGGLPKDIGSVSSLKELYLTGNNFEYLPRSITQLGVLQFLNLSDCSRLKELPSFMGMPNLVTLDLSNCMNLEEVHHSLGFLKKLFRLELTNCKRLKRFPALRINSLEYLYLQGCSNLENFPEPWKHKFGVEENLGSINLELKSEIRYLDLRDSENLVALRSSICRLKSLVSLNVPVCSKLESFPAEIGDLETLNGTCTIMSRPPSSIVRLNKA